MKEFCGTSISLLIAEVNYGNSREAPARRELLIKFLHKKILSNGEMMNSLFFVDFEF